jgi:hypothetical protein
MLDRRSTILVALLLSACSEVPRAAPLPESNYVTPKPPTEKAVASAVAAIAGEAKLVKPLEVSAIRPNDHGPGSFFVCVREINPPPDKPRRYYATFLDNEVYKGSRLAVIMDQCESQAYSPAPDAPPAAPPPDTQTTKPAKHKSHTL